MNWHCKIKRAEAIYTKFDISHFVPKKEVKMGNFHATNYLNGGLWTYQIWIVG